jgi:hypothetical protein
MEILDSFSNDIPNYGLVDNPLSSSMLPEPA